MAVEPLDLAELATQRYADVEVLLVDWIEQALAALNLRAMTQLPEGDDLTAQLAECGGIIHVEVYDGNETSPIHERVNVDIDVYKGQLPDGNADDDGAADLADLLRAALLFHLPGYYAGPVTVSSVATISRPVARPYDDNSQVSRRQASYQLTVATRG